VTNNYLSHRQWQDLRTALDACKAKNTDCAPVVNAYRILNRANDAALLEACRDPSSPACTTRTNEALGGRGQQDTLGIPDSVLGAGSQGNSNLILGNVLADRNRQTAQAACDANPQNCITTPEGMAQVGIGGIKGVARSPIDLLNTGPAVVNGYGYIADTVTGNPLTPRVTPLPYPDALDTQGGLQGAGAVGGGVIGGAVLIGGANAVLRPGAGTTGAAATAAAEPAAGAAPATSGTRASGTAGRTAIVDGAGAPGANPPNTIAYQPTGAVVMQGNAPVCGPACAAMTITDRTGATISLDATIGNFPNGIRPTGVNAAEISNVLNGSGIKSTVNTSMLPSELNQALANGNTVIVNVGDHFIIVDGTRTVNGVMYYMTRDPAVGPRGVIGTLLNNVMSRGVNAVVVRR
jgi:hypothetical protein